MMSILVGIASLTCCFSAGATGLNAAVESAVVTLSWRYLPTILASSLIMLGWALIINNVGRRRYPVYWWAAGKTFVSATKEQKLKEKSRELREVETGLRMEEGSIFDEQENGQQIAEKIDQKNGQTNVMHQMEKIGNPSNGST